MNINRNSWHYKLLALSSVARSMGSGTYDVIVEARRKGLTFVEIYEDKKSYFWGSYLFKLPNNSCQYIREAVIIPFSFIFINLVFLVGLVSLICYALFAYPLLVIAGIGSFIAATAILIAMLTFIYVVSTKSRDFIEGFVQNSDNTITNAIYTNYKDKICTIVKLEDN